MPRARVAAPAGGLALACALAHASPAAAQDFRALADDARAQGDGERSGAPPAPSAPDPPAPPFGARGEWVVTGASSAGVSSTEYDGSAATYLWVGFSPGLDWFVARNVSVGLTLDAEFYRSQGYGADSSLVATRTTTLRGGPRVGWNLPLGARFSLYPRLAVGFEWLQREEALVSGASLSIAGAPLGYPSTSQFGPWMDLYVPLLWHVAPHVFVGFGPDVFHDFGATQGGPDIGGQRTTVGAGLIVGGWWGGPSAVPAAQPEDQGEGARVRRFGEAGEIVLTSDFGTSGYYTSYAGSPASSSSLGIEPGVDYFVAAHVALGIALDVEFSSVTGLDASAQAKGGAAPLTVTNSSSRLGFVPRLAFDVPLGQALSLYPRASIAMGGSGYDERSGSSVNSHGDNYLTAALYVPLLVHPAQHFFLGFGPSVSHDLERPNTVNGASNRATIVGASLIVGGWL